MPDGEKEKGISFVRIESILERIPISRSSWWAGCKSGKYPKPIKIGPRTTAWRMSDINALLEKLNSQTEEK